jgi:hypothetical protein
MACLFSELLDVPRVASSVELMSCEPVLALFALGGSSASYVIPGDAMAAALGNGEGEATC